MGHRIQCIGSMITDIARRAGANVGPEPTTDRFMAVMHGQEDRVLPGNAVGKILERECITGRVSGGGCARVIWTTLGLTITGHHGPCEPLVASFLSPVRLSGFLVVKYACVNTAAVSPGKPFKGLQVFGE